MGLSKLERRANWIGIAWMISAMALFSLEDAFVKTLFNTVPIGQIMVFFGIGGTALCFGLACYNREPLFRSSFLSRSMRFKMAFEILGRLFYALAITLTPLSSATVILQATPVVVVAGAAIIFHENVSGLKWIAIGIGLIGVGIVMRPGSESFSYMSLLAVLGMLGFAGRDLATRATSKAISATILGFYGFLAVLVAGLILSVWQTEPYSMPDSKSMLLLMGMVITGVVAYFMLTKAMRIGEISVVTPFRYSRLIFGITMGVLLFGEPIDTEVVLGCSLIVFSGLLVVFNRKAGLSG